jgi:hypothetical protein
MIFNNFKGTQITVMYIRNAEILTCHVSDII